MPLPLELIAYLAFLGSWVALAPEAKPDAAWAATAVFAAGGAGFLFSLLLERRSRTASGPAAARPHTAALWTSAADPAARAACAVLAASATALSGWPVAWMRPDADGGGFFLPCLAGLAPYGWVFLCVWWPLYPWHRRHRPGNWTRGSYLWHKMRYSLYPLPLWLPFLATTEYVSLSGPFLLAEAALCAWIAPWGLRWLWNCRPAHQLPWLGLRVENLQRRAGVAFRSIHLWEPGGGATLNAAAVGLLPPFRYLFITPELARCLPPEEFDAVVAHELGHIRHRHLLLYLISALTFLSLVWIAVSESGLFFPIEQVGVEILTLVVYWRFVFGWLSRRMERQADLYVLELLGRPEPLANALERLALGMAGGRRAWSWHHGDIAGRVHFLREAAKRPALVRAHHQTVARVHGLTLAAAVLLIAYWLTAANPPASRLARDAAADSGLAGPWTAERHWRRTARTFPSHPAGPLILARRAWRA